MVSKHRKGKPIMAKSTSEILPTDTLANLYAAENSVVIAEVGGKNTDTAQAELWFAKFPASDVSNLAAFKQFSQNNLPQTT